MLQQILRTSYNGLVGNVASTWNFQDAQTFVRNGDLNEGVGEVHHTETYGKGFMKGIKLEFPRSTSHKPSAWVHRANQYFLYH